jgi:hypothetical protein
MSISHTSKSQQYVGAILVSLLAVGVTGCGKGQGQFVKDVQIRTYTQNNDVYAEVKAQVDTGKLSIPGITLPILNPKQPGVIYGSIGLNPSLNGGSELTLDVDVTAATGVQGIDGSLLPNGSPIPVGGLGNVPVVGLQAGANSKIYVAVGPGVAVLGVALTVHQFDNVGGNIPIPINLFPSFKLANGVTGIAGIFTGPVSGQNGVALFVDASAAFGTASTMTARALSDLKVVPTAPSRVFFIEPRPAADDEYRVKMGLYQLNRKRSRVDVR